MDRTESDRRNMDFPMMDYLDFRAGFASIIDPRFYTIEWLDQQVWAGFARCWACDDAAIIAEVKTYPTGATEVHGIAATGNLESIVNTLIPLAEEWGRSMGCITASISSRPGWVKALPDYHLYQTTIRKEL